MTKVMLIIQLLIGLLLIPNLGWADFQAAQEAYFRGDYPAALKELRQLAKNGHAMAQVNLGSMYYKGEGVPKNYIEAAKWTRLAAEQGNVMGQGRLGEMYFKGLGVPKDYAKAVKWTRLAAEQGDMYSQSQFGEMYAEGRGVLQDYVLAHMWLNLAAAQGSEFAYLYRKELEEKMLPIQIAEAQRLAREWKPKGK